MYDYQNDEFWALTTPHRLLDILEVIVPYKHFHKLRQFVQNKIPEGFPVKLGQYGQTVCSYYSWIEDNRAFMLASPDRLYLEA